jgi:dienelactone hydrolase
MGTIILIVAFVIEAAFAAYCILTKSNQNRIRSFVRIGAFAVFVIFTLASVIKWSFLWYGLAGLLLVWAALGALTLIRRQGKKQDYKAGRIVLKAIGMLLLVAIAVTPALIFPQYRLPKVTGKYAVATVDYTFTDASRIETFAKTGENRRVVVEFWYPKDTDGKYPLVVFSPGSLGMRTSNTSTFVELASNGYVVCSIDHPYDSLFTQDRQGHTTTIDPSFMQEIMGVNNGKYDEATVFKLEQKWMLLRTTDMNFVLDTSLAQAKQAGSDPVYQLIDTGKIGLIGHSLGGSAGGQVGRQRNDIGAVVDLDADLIGEYLDYVDGKYVINDSIYPVPILFIYSDELWRRFAGIADLNNVVASKKVAATAPHAYEVHFAGTNHMSLTDLPLQSPFLVAMINSTYRSVGGSEADKYYVIEKMNSLVLEFFNAYLKGEGSFTSAGTY